MKINIEKLEEKDVVFSNEKPTKEQDLEFSKFLKERKLKIKNAKDFDELLNIKYGKIGTQIRDDLEKDWYLNSFDKICE